MEEFFALWCMDQGTAAMFTTSNVVMCCGAILVLLGIVCLLLKRCSRKVYMVDFACYKPGTELMCSKEQFLEESRSIGVYSEETLDFLRKILKRSGVGDKTYIPEAMKKRPLNLCLSESMKEVEMLLFGCIDQVLKKTGVNPKQIGILVVNCCLLSPEPSLSAVVVNHYKFRNDVRSFNLCGMGCSAGLIAIDLANNLLKVHPNSYALVVIVETMSVNWYRGNKKSMLVANCLFRVGGAAILLSNLPSDRQHSKYQLTHSVRTHNGADDRSYKCAYFEEDEEDKIGLELSKDLMAVAGHVLKANITALGPLVLPISEQLLFLATLLSRKIFKMKMIKRARIPDFKLAFDHFCIHAGGRAVLDEMEKNLNLSEWDMEPSRMTLYRFGNTSSSSLLYQLAYCEAKGRIKKNDRTWQIGFGSGFKCISLVWRALKTIIPDDQEPINPWMDEIHEFPVDVSTSVA